VATVRFQQDAVATLIESWVERESRTARLTICGTKAPAEVRFSGLLVERNLAS
jgi:hypothetical protein